MIELEATHQNKVAKLSKPGGDIHFSMTPEKCDLMHAALGLAGEVGEIVDTIKKHCIYEQPLDLDNIQEELGDLEFYMEQLRQAVGIKRDETLISNNIKLATRYPNYEYTNTRAKERADKQPELF